MLKKKLIIPALIVSSMLYYNIEAQALNLDDSQLEVNQHPTYIEDVYTADIPTEEQLQDLAKRKQDNTIEMFNIIPEGVYRTISVPSFKQETYYYCGPATIKQVVHFLTGSSQSQATYASQLGTTPNAGSVFSLVDDILNNNQKKVVYHYGSIGTYDNWANTIKRSLEKNHPPILDLQISPSYMPKYSSVVQGHILNVSGINTTTVPFQVRLTDPFDEGGRGVTLGNVWHPHKGVYDANNAHFRQAMIYGY